MAHDPARVAEARAWIVRAARDLRAAEHEFQAVPPLLDDIAALRPIIDQAVPLTEYAWKFRYPGEMEEPSRTEAEDAFATAHKVYAAIISRLPAEAQ